MKKALFILNPRSYELIYGEQHYTQIAQLVHLPDSGQGSSVQSTKSIIENPSQLQDIELIFSGWGAPVLDVEFLDNASKLEAVFYGAGTVRGIVTDAMWERGIVLTCAAAINAIPVAEYTLSQIFFSLKRGWYHMLEIERKGRAGWQKAHVPGAYGSKVGIIALGEIGRLVCQLLQPFDLEVLAYDPFVDEHVFEELGVKRVELEQLFAKCDVVSLHAPNLPSTKGMIRGEHLRCMKRDSTFLNTSRGDIVDEKEMVAVLAERPDLWAVLDVLAEGDRGVAPQLYDLPNVVMTPHIAGSLNQECRRMGQAMVDELRRYLAGEPLRWQVTPEKFRLMA